MTLISDQQGDQPKLPSVSVFHFGIRYCGYFFTYDLVGTPFEDFTPVMVTAVAAAVGGPAGEFPANIFEPAKTSEKILRANNNKNKRTSD